MAIHTEEELGEALKREQDSIEIEGDLKRKIVRIRATGKIAWVIAFAAIAIAVAILLSTGGTGAPVSALLSGGAISVLGLSAATSAVSIAYAAGSVGVLNSLRDYKVVSDTGDKLVLSRG